VKWLERRTCDPEVLDSTLGYSTCLKANQALNIPPRVNKLYDKPWLGGQRSLRLQLHVMILGSVAAWGTVYGWLISVVCTAVCYTAQSLRHIGLPGIHRFETALPLQYLNSHKVVIRILLPVHFFCRPTSPPDCVRHTIVSPVVNHYRTTCLCKRRTAPAAVYFPGNS
jgi:hypothetical protein